MRKVKPYWGLITVVTSIVYADWAAGTRLPDAVNSVYNETDPCFVEEENILYFASDRYNGPGVYDIYYSYKIGPNNWTPAEKVPGNINTSYIEYGPFVTWDRNKLYFCRFAGAPTTIWVAERQGSWWGEPYKIPGYVNHPGRAYNRNPAISNTGEILFFDSERPGNIATINIWYSKWNGSEWSTPYFIIGINTTYGEYDPSPTYDDVWLYFCSLRPFPDGNIYRARNLGNGNWGEVERLNSNVNVYGYIYCGPFVTKSGRYLFYSCDSISPPTDWDIYVSEWSEPAVAPTSLGKIKALYR